MSVNQVMSQARIVSLYIAKGYDWTWEIDEDDEGNEIVHIMVYNEEEVKKILEATKT